MTEATVHTLAIDATPEAVFAVAADVASYPEWASGVKEVEVLETDDRGRPSRARFVIEGLIKELRYQLTYTYDEPTNISWVAEPNADLKYLEGSYTFTATNDHATEVVYALHVEPNFMLPGFLRRQAERQIVTTALRGLRKRVGDLG